MLRKIASLYILILFIFFWGFSTAYFHIFPWNIIDKSFKEIEEYLTFQDGNKKSLAEKILFKHQEFKTKFQDGGFIVRDKAFVDKGFLLISRFSRKHDQTIIELFDIANKKNQHTWIPDLDAIFEITPKHRTGINTRMAYRSQHPLLLENGDIIMTSGEGPLVRISPDGNPVWAIDMRFHHSIELDSNGNIVALLAMINTNNAIPFRDDVIAIVNPDGKLLKIYSISQALIDDGYRGLLYGVGNFELDRIHLNDAQPINRPINDIAVGDIAWSSRHLSTVGLFRPSTGKIVWIQVGPWLAQHDINMLMDGRFSIFGNDIGRINPTDPLIKDYDIDLEPWINSTKTSEIYIFDPASKKVTTPYSQMMFKYNIRSKYSGRARILNNGDVCIEETDKSRILRISTDKVRWEFINKQSETALGALHWSRYLYENEVNLSWKKEY